MSDTNHCKKISAVFGLNNIMMDFFIRIKYHDDLITILAYNISKVWEENLDNPEVISRIPSRPQFEICGFNKDIEIVRLESQLDNRNFIIRVSEKPDFYIVRQINNQLDTVLIELHRLAHSSLFKDIKISIISNQCFVLYFNSFIRVYKLSLTETKRYSLIG
jgi:hypothetical protein